MDFWVINVLAVIRSLLSSPQADSFLQDKCYSLYRRKVPAKEMQMGKGEVVKNKGGHG